MVNSETRALVEVLVSPADFPHEKTCSRTYACVLPCKKFYNSN